MKSKQLMILMISLALMAGCAASPETMQEKTASDSGASYTLEETEDYAPGIPVNDAQTDTGQVASDKIIYNGSLQMQTGDLDSTSRQIEEAVRSLDGFIESQSRGTEDASGLGYAGFQVRIPAGSYDAFIEKAGQAGNVTSEDKTASNITKSYNDTKSRLDSLRREESRLNELMDQAQSVADIAAVEDQLRQVQDQIGSLQQSLDGMDQDIAYSTIWIQVQETAPSGGLGYAFDHTWSAFGDALGHLAIALVYLLPWLLVILVLGALLWLVLRRRKRQRAIRAQSGDLPDRKPETGPAPEDPKA